MQVNHQYASPSMCLSDENATTLGLSPDLSRSEKVSFCGKVKNSLVFRDAMLMLRDIVTSDSRVKPKDRADYFAWLESEIDRQVLATLEDSSNVADGIKAEIKEMKDERKQLHQRIKQAKSPYDKIKKEYDEFDVWKDYNKLEKKFWKFIRERDVDLWFVLDPVITVHPDQVSFEAFSIDESIYGCLSMTMDAFEMKQEPSLGTTNIDFSEKLAVEMSRFRLEEDVELSVNPSGFAIDSGVMPQHIEKKIDLPETWIAGFNQVSSAAQLPALIIDLTSTDIYDICSFLRRFKAHKSPRYMKWMLTPQEPIKIEFQPFGYVMELQSIYQGTKPREEKVWGRQRWTVLEKLIPLADRFTVHLLGFSMPQFVVAHMGDIQMTVGFSAWSSHDWVSGTSFNILNGFIGESAYQEVYKLLKEKRTLPVAEIYQELSDIPQTQVHAGIGELMRRGEGYYDLVANKVRFRQLCSEPIPNALFKPNYMEQRVLKLLDNKDVLFENLTTDPNLISLSLKFKLWESAPKFREAKLTMDEDGQIQDMSCECYQFKKGSKNMSDACEHIFNLYLHAVQITKEEANEERL